MSLVRRFVFQFKASRFLARQIQTLNMSWKFVWGSAKFTFEPEISRIFAIFFVHHLIAARVQVPFGGKKRER